MMSFKSKRWMLIFASVLTLGMLLSIFHSFYAKYSSWLTTPNNSSSNEISTQNPPAINPVESLETIVHDTPLPFDNPIDATDILDNQDLYSTALMLLEKANQSDGNSQFELYKILRYCETAKFETAEKLIEIYQELGVELSLNHLNAVENKISQCNGFNAQTTSNFIDTSKITWLEKSYQAGDPQGSISYIAFNLRQRQQWNQEKNRADFDKEFKAPLMKALQQGNNLPYSALSNISYMLGDSKFAKALLVYGCQMGEDCSAKSKASWRKGAILDCLATKKDPKCFDTADLDYAMLKLYKKDGYQAIKADVQRIKEQLKTQSFAELYLKHLALLLKPLNQ